MRKYIKWVVNYDVCDLLHVGLPTTNDYCVVLYCIVVLVMKGYFQAQCHTEREDFAYSSFRFCVFCTILEVIRPALR